MDTSALVVSAVLLGFGGLVAYLVGVGSLAETRRLLREGVPTEALVKQRPGSDSAPLLQFDTDEEGPVMEVFSPVPSARSLPLVDGRTVRIVYDRADPRKLLVLGRERRAVDYTFAAAGVALFLTAVVLVVSAA
ncbi:MULTISPECIES: DUF3592 domain-containing protein [Streptacidiphilus]|uniref:DUF3592 domain-containing protein n=1 Tax=Streptacidiphilus cavernicola TaxID=3342716 RepID=A0ABV6UUS7_9ACTN|nr:DUF3592 domain-containing protein [Streptacidiphilus jeojiense]